MLFSSFPYIFVFLPVAVVGSISIRKMWGPKAAQLWVLTASVVFYAKSNPLNLIYLFISILANWMVACAIEGTNGRPRKKRILFSALTFNVLYLCAFKYLGFFASIWISVFPTHLHVPDLGFPLGISFFTITQIMYLIDCYEETLTAGSLLDHASFVAFFPYLISGPLGRPKRMRHQFVHFGGQDESRSNMIARGLFLFSLGLFKKSFFADSFAQVVAYGNASAINPSALEGWIFGIAYAMQIYFDFSGYSDMAIGSALMLGIDIPRNFDSPYSATSITEFWQRWHISLTNFITTYLFTPIFRTFKKRSIWASAIATFIAMGIAGFWHGAGWKYIAYGLLHGSYLAINQIWRKQKYFAIPAFPSWCLTFSSVVVAFIVFGADTLQQGVQRVSNLFNIHHPFSLKHLMSLSLTVNSLGIRIVALPLIIGVFISLSGTSSEQRARDFLPTMRTWSYAVCLTVVALVMMNSVVSAPFIYFKF